MELNTLVRNINAVCEEYNNDSTDGMGFQIKLKKGQLLVKKIQLREQWINKWVDTYMDDNRAQVALSDRKNGLTIVTISQDDKYPAVGKAYLRPGDTFNQDTGVAIAYVRALGLKVPNFL